MRINQNVLFAVSVPELDFIQTDFNQRLATLVNKGDECFVQKRKASNVAAILVTFEQVKEDQMAQLRLLKHSYDHKAFLLKVQVIGTDGEYYDSGRPFWINLNMETHEIQAFITLLSNSDITLDSFDDLSTDHAYQVKRIVVAEVKKNWREYIRSIGVLLDADSLNAEFVVTNNDPNLPEYFVCYPAPEDDHPYMFECMYYDHKEGALINCVEDIEYFEKEEVKDCLTEWYQRANI